MALKGFTADLLVAEEGLEPSTTFVSGCIIRRYGRSFLRHNQFITTSSHPFAPIFMPTVIVTDIKPFLSFVIFQCCEGTFHFLLSELFHFFARPALGEGRPSPSGTALSEAIRNFMIQLGGNKK